MDARSSLLRIIDPACFALGLASAAVGGHVAPLVCAVTPPLLFRLLWNERTPPVFLVCLLMQWLYTSINVFYSSFSGYYPGVDSGFPNVDLTMTIIMAGLACQAFGFAFAFRLLTANSPSQPAAEFPYDVNRLRWISVIYALIALALSSVILRGSAATFIKAFLQFRLVVLALVAYGTFVHRSTTREMMLTGLTILISTVLCFGSRQSIFKEVILISLAATVCAIRISPKTYAQKLNNRRVVIAVTTTFLALLYAGILWESQIKPNWRFRDLPEGKIERISEFMRLVAAKAPEADPFSGVDALFKRMNNMWQMSLVLERVPLRIPHADGSLTWMAVKHVLMPRILFPDKMTLDVTNRLLAEKYLGIRIGENASVGIGYMTEFYVDFGLAGAFLAAFCLGLVLGGVCAIVVRIAPSYEIGLAIALVALWEGFGGFETNLAKGLGSFLSFMAIFVVLGWIVQESVRRVPRRMPEPMQHPLRTLVRN